MQENEEKKIIDTAVNAAKAQQQTNSTLGITREYNKDNRNNLWDSTKGKQQYKEKVFQDKQTVVDPISGEVLHKSHTAAQKKYHMKNAEGEKVSTKWAKHASETDHINSIKSTHDKVKYNPYLSDADFKEIVNSDENYRILSKQMNTSKGEKSDWQIISDKKNQLSKEGKIQIAKEKIRSDVALSAKFTAKTAENMGKEFVSGAKDVVIKSAIPLTAEAVRQMVAVANGEKTFGEASKEMAKTTVDVAVAGGTNKLLVDAVTQQLSNSKSAVLKNIASSNAAAQIIAVAAIVQQSAVRYINGEISGEEFISEVGEKGTAMVVGMIGGQIGREIGGIIGAVIGTGMLPGVGTVAGDAVGQIVGEILGTIITTVACGAIVSVFHTMAHLDDYKLKENQISLLTEEAKKEIRNQREIFKDIVKREHGHWNAEIEAGFKMIWENIDDAEGIASGLDRILNVFGKEVTFKTVTEYEAQLDQPLILKL